MASGRCGVRLCLISLKTMRWIYKNNKKLYRFKKAKQLPKDIIYVRDGPKRYRRRTIDVMRLLTSFILAQRQPYKHTQVQVYNRYYNSHYTPYYQYCILHIPTWGSISHVNGSHRYIYVTLPVILQSTEIHIINEFQIQPNMASPLFQPRQ